MRLLVTITAHGYGHIAQTGPVIEAWMRRFPATELFLACAADDTVVAQHLRVPYQTAEPVPDIGMLMGSALDVLSDASHQAYLDLHRDWPQRVHAEAERIGRLAPDLLISNVSYLSLAAAASIGVPAVGMCSLNWADIYAAYCGGKTGAPEVLVQIREAYRSAQRFLAVQPGLRPEWMGNMRMNPPIARRTAARSGRLRQGLNCGPDDRLVVINGGGIDMPLPINAWPVIAGVRWLVPDHWPVDSDRVIRYADTRLDFRSMLLASDAVLTKPGYGMFVDAACNGLPVIYIPRGDWPEEPFLIEWLHRHGRAVRIEREQAREGRLADALATLWNRPAPQVVPGDGVTVAVDAVYEVLA